MFCPRCKAEFREGFTHCKSCNIDLIDDFLPSVSKEVTHGKLFYIFKFLGIILVSIFLVFALLFGTFIFIFSFGNPLEKYQTTQMVKEYILKNYPTEKFVIQKVELDYRNGYKYILKSEKIKRKFLLFAFVRDGISYDEYKEYCEDKVLEAKISEQIISTFLNEIQWKLHKKIEVNIDFYIRKGKYAPTYNYDYHFKEPINLDIYFLSDNHIMTDRDFFDYSLIAKDIILEKKFNINRLIFWLKEDGITFSKQMVLDKIEMHLSEEELLNNGKLHEIEDSHI